MNRATITRLALADGGAIVRRWQSFWLNRPIIWSGQQWDYAMFSWDGLLSGQSSDQITLTMPATPSNRAMVERALADAWLATLEIYQAPDDGAIDAGPTSETVLVGAVVGQVIEANGDLSELSVSLGSALSPIGAQFPPLTATTALIGVPCRF